jgi:hypothetical protein
MEGLMLADLSLADLATLGKASPFDSCPQSRQRRQKKKDVFFEERGRIPHFWLFVNGIGSILRTKNHEIRDDYRLPRGIQV